VLRICLRDWGSGHAPGALPREVADPEKPGGLGLLCMGRLMDKVSFTPQTKGMLLEMRKRLRKS
jgi:anti-sigma regulatory factor (Ser/Thr protein kinase)